MTGVCGWTGAFAGPSPPDHVLRAMAGTLVPTRAAHDSARPLAEAALHVRSVDPRGALWIEDDLWAAIEGYPTWTEPGLAQVAAKRGHGAALREAYREHGTDLFRHLQGPFSLAVIEPAAGRALIAIDRFGVRSMCYARGAAGGLVFGSTADAVRAHPAVGATIGPQNIYDYLFNYVCPAPTTIYREQRKLLPAQYLVFDGGETRTAFYWRMPYREDGPDRVDDLAAELKEVLGQATRRALSTGPANGVGAFLSGGLDSSTVVGFMRQATGRPPETFTVRFDEDAYDESRYARAAARHFQANHYEYTLTPKDVLDLIPKLAEVYDEPFGNSSAIPAYYCARTAREHGVELLLAGDGGDELFAGNKRYVAQQVFALYDRLPRALRSYLVEPVVFGLPGLGGTALVRKARNYIGQARIPMPDRTETRNLWGTLDLAEVFEPDRLAEIDPEEPLRLRRKVYARTGTRSMLQAMMHLDLTTALADNDLRKVNRMCAMAGVQVRYPFLDEAVAEFSARVPPRLLIRRLEIRELYKRALHDFLPAETLRKKKHGFGMPFAIWLKNDPDLCSIACDSLEAFKSRHYFKASFVDRMIEAHRQVQRSPLDVVVWDVMMLELWLQAHTRPARRDGPPPPPRPPMAGAIGIS